MQRVLLTGVSGITGKAGLGFLKHLDRIVSPEDRVSVLQHNNPVDLSLTAGRKNIEIITSLPSSTEYDTAIHLAANIHTSKGRTPEEFPGFKRDNIDLTRRVCRSALYVIHASTDCVFSGNGNGLYMETDTPDATNYYGTTKAIAEEIVGAHAGANVRFSVPVGTSDNLIIDKVFNRIEGRKAWPFWNDQYVGISLIDDVVGVFNLLYRSGRPGMYHVASEGTLSRAELAWKVLDVYRSNDILRVNDSIEEESCNDPLFPRRLGLSTARTRKILGISSFTSIDDAVRLHVLRAKKPELLISS
ncbi:MAG: sugar nucleotide-binding protein [Nanoarchaeota archaeon]